LLLSQDRSDCSLTVPDRESLLLSIYAEWLTYYELFCQRWGWSANVVSERMVIRLRQLFCPCSAGGLKLRFICCRRTLSQIIFCPTWYSAERTALQRPKRRSPLRHMSHTANQIKEKNLYIKLNTSPRIMITPTCTLAAVAQGLHLIRYLHKPVEEPQ